MNTATFQADQSPTQRTLGGWDILLRSVALGVVLTGVVGCGSGDGFSEPGNGVAPVQNVSPAPKTYTVTGTVSGLASGQQFTLLLNGDTTTGVTVSSNGAFAMGTVPAKASYAVTVGTAAVWENCTVTNGSGSSATANVTNVSVACVGSSLQSRNGLLIDSAGNLYGTTSGGGAHGLGTIFKVTSAGVESLLYSFAGGNDGQTPVSSLVIDSSGNLYGTTVDGGSAGMGTVYMLTPAGVETVLYSFGTGTDGQNPYGSLLADNAGNFYGTTYSGGTAGNGTVFKLTAAGVESVVHNFAGGVGDGANPRGSLVADSSGNLYGTTYAGGTDNFGTAFMITAAGVESVLHNLTGNPDAKYSRGSFYIDGSGNMYATSIKGGSAADKGTVFMITPAGVESIVHVFGAGTDGALPEAGLLADSSGNLYGTTYFGGTLNYGTVFKITPAGVESVLYSFTSGADGQNPYGSLVADSSGNLYGVTTNGGTPEGGVVFKITPGGVETVLYSFLGGADGQQPYD